MAFRPGTLVRAAGVARVMLARPQLRSRRRVVFPEKLGIVVNGRVQLRVPVEQLQGPLPIRVEKGPPLQRKKAHGLNGQWRIVSILYRDREIPALNAGQINREIVRDGGDGITR